MAGPKIRPDPRSSLNKGVVDGIYVAREGSAAMERVEEVRTIAGCGIEGDRYCKGTGF